ncbi:MAG: hypothetical protein QXU34_08205 [Ignisphaera sp.]
MEVPPSREERCREVRNVNSVLSLLLNSFGRSVFNKLAIVEAV